MVSNPIGLRGAADVFVRTIKSVSIAAAESGLATVRKFPNVFGNVSANENTVDEFRSTAVPAA